MWTDSPPRAASSSISLNASSASSSPSSGPGDSAPTSTLVPGSSSRCATSSLRSLFCSPTLLPKNLLFRFGDAALTASRVATVPDKRWTLFWFATFLTGLIDVVKGEGEAGAREKKLRIDAAPFAG